MDSHLREVLQNAQPGKYILPFFWLHGESREELLEELIAIKDAGITEFCLESRTHEAFGTEPWFADFQFFMEAARYHGMLTKIISVNPVFSRPSMTASSFSSGSKEGSTTVILRRSII